MQTVEIIFYISLNVYNHHHVQENEGRRWITYERMGYSGPFGSNQLLNQTNADQLENGGILQMNPAVVNNGQIKPLFLS